VAYDQRGPSAASSFPKGHMPLPVEVGPHGPPGLKRRVEQAEKGARQLGPVGGEPVVYPPLALVDPALKVPWILRMGGQLVEGQAVLLLGLQGRGGRVTGRARPTSRSKRASSQCPCGALKSILTPSQRQPGRDSAGKLPHLDLAGPNTSEVTSVASLNHTPAQSQGLNFPAEVLPSAYHSSYPVWTWVPSGRGKRKNPWGGALDSVMAPDPAKHDPKGHLSRGKGRPG
jgi:hypothetical protein